MRTLILYTTDGCHLCEQAERLLRELGDRQSFTLEAVDISTDEALADRYGIRIPVVKNPASAEELGWPFQLEDLAHLL
jgi:glutaredoxin